MFAAKLVHDRDDEVIDTRGLKTEIVSRSLPADVERQLIRYVREAGLVYSAIDLRYSQDRGYVFFDANPGGQYLDRDRDRLENQQSHSEKADRRHSIQEFRV